MNSELHLVGLNHKTAPVEVRERFALSDPLREERLFAAVRRSLSEYFALSTCNRVELLGVGGPDAPAESLIPAWAEAADEDAGRLRPYLYTHSGPAAAGHLFAVASGLDSMVIGEPQILGQIKAAYRAALGRGGCGLILNRLMHKTFSVAKRVRTETGTAAGAVSVSYAAVELAKRIFEDMSRIRAMLIGAGETAELAAAHLVGAGVSSVLVVNRTPERAEQLAASFGGRAAPFEKLFEHLAEADIVVSSTGSQETIVRAADMRGVMRRRRNRPVFIIDIAVPRDVDPEVNNLDNVYLYDIDDLREVVEANMGRRREEAARGRAIVDEEAEHFRAWMCSLDLQPTIVDIVDRGERIAGQELERTLKRLGPLPAGGTDILKAAFLSLAGKLNHEPLMYLKGRYPGRGAAGDAHIAAVRDVFNLDNECTPDKYRKGR
ncbi:MAG: glutamyl-tRNA reductase [Desulfovibrio sp.]|jgi:glutamyl-tRNA reductase|nr:glutamyl-tRNA reductase [Desulfovibrio sp.]